MMDANGWAHTFRGLGPKQRAAVVCTLQCLGAKHAALDQRKALGTVRLLVQTADSSAVFSVTPRGWVKRTALDAAHWMFPR